MKRHQLRYFFQVADLLNLDKEQGLKPKGPKHSYKNIRLVWMLQVVRNLSYLVLLFLLLFLPKEMNAQSNERLIVYSLSASIFDEHIATPFGKKKGSPIHLGGTIALERARMREGVYQFTQVFQAGYYHHKGFHQAAFIAWKPKFELRFANTINIHAIPGIGYAHSFPTQQSYQLDNGKYNKKTNFGKPHLIPSFGLGTGLHFDRLLGVPAEFFVRYELFSLAPYTTKGELPFTLSTAFSLGLKYNL